MKYAYPQDPTSAISSIRRADESANSTTQQSSLERQQEIAIVGQTVPLVFCHRFDWGDGLGVNGGVWFSPLLIQLGIEQTGLSMMYIISQGEVDGLKTENTYWGYQKLTDIDTDGSMCYAYEAVPACLDLDYVPGGSVSWDTTITGAGPSFGGKQAKFTTADDCRKIVFSFSSEIRVSGNAYPVTNVPSPSRTGLYYSEYGGYDDPKSSGFPNGDGTVATGSGYCRWRLWDTWGYNDPYYGETPSYAGGGDSGGGGDSSGGDSSGGGGNVDQGRATRATIIYRPEVRNWDFAKYVKAYPFDVTSEVRFDYVVIDLESLQEVKSGQVWIEHGSTALTIELPAGKYEVQFSERYSERDSAAGSYAVIDPGTDACNWSTQYANARNAFGNYVAPEGHVRATPPGTKTETINCTVTQTIYNELSFPELPGGGQQLVGGLDDLTLMGINGDVTLLRPVEGPNYFMQSHVFIEDGIKVDRLTLGGHGPSPYYGDLINYLLNKTEILQQPQIDSESMALVNRMHANYKMFYNGVLQVTSSFNEWLTRTAPYFLVAPRQVNGRYGIWPVCPLNADHELSRDPVVPALTITADDIVADSYSRNYLSARDRKPICLIMVYRDQPVSQVGQTVSIEVRYEGTALSGPYESHDLTDFCCRAEQAVIAARYILAKRRFTTHVIEFAMGRRGAQLLPGDIIKVDLDLSTTDGEGIKDSFFYQIDALTESQNGEVLVEATHYPVDGNGISVIAYQTHEGSVSIT